MDKAVTTYRETLIVKFETDNCSTSVVYIACMNFLILINSAPGYQPFFLAIGNELVEQGHQVVYAVESRLGNIEYPQDKIPDTPYVFSEYLKAHPENTALPSPYAHLNIWESFFSDFDRFEHFNTNLTKDNDWYSRVVSGLFSFFEYIFSQEAIDLVLYENISNSFSYAAFLVAKNHAVPYLGWTSCRIPGRYESHTGIDSQRGAVALTYQQIKEGRILLDEATRTWCETYLKNFMGVAPDYMATNGLLLQNPISKYARTAKWERVYHRFLFVLSYPSWAYPYHFGNPLLFSFKQFLRNASRYLKSIRIQKLFTFPHESEKYFLYPIHFHPESSTSISARHYVDEAIVIKNIAFNLPYGYLLYVKDHKSAVGYPSLEFYRTLNQLPNVRLIHPDAPTKTLISHATGIITLTSTVGYEAIVLRKPVVVLGDVFYDFHPLCRKMSRWADLFAILLEISMYTPEEDHQDCVDFVASYYLNTRPGTLLIGGDVPAELKYTLVKQAIQLAQKEIIESGN